MLKFYDFEVFKHDWMTVVIDPESKSETVIHNDKEALADLYYGCRDKTVWVGYNNRRYDQYIMRGIVAGFDPKEVNDWIIRDGRHGWQFSHLLGHYPMHNYDVMPNPPVSLKTLEGFMGASIEETSVPFDVDRPLTEAEVAATVAYCRYDVQKTMDVFLETYERFESVVALIKMFGLPLSCVGKTDAQLVAEILGCRKIERYDEWDLRVLDCIRLEKHAGVADWFMDPLNQDYSCHLDTEVAGCPHRFGWGGVHGALPKYHSEGCLLHVDVTSYYPSLLIKHGLVTRSATMPERYEGIYDERVRYKGLGMKKEQLPLKRALNAITGAEKDPYNKAYDPRNNNLMCVNGQLMLLDLMERLEGLCTLVQSNTDGLIIEIDDTDEAFYRVDDACAEWESRTGMRLALDQIREIWQKDVNNYIWIDGDGGMERKGAYVKELGPLDNDLPVVNRAVVDAITRGVPPEQTVYEAADLIDFQKIVKVSSKYLYGWHNGERLAEKTFRVFASTCPEDTFIGKVKSEGGKPEKFANTPDHCFIDNGEMGGLPAEDPLLDRDWYVDLAEKRLEDYGVAL